MKTNGHAVTEHTKHFLLANWLVAGIANDFPVLGVPPSQITHVRDSMKNTANDLAALQVATTTLPPLFVGEGKISHELWLWPGVARNFMFPLTAVLHLRTRRQQDGISQTGPAALDTVFSSALWLSPKKPHPLLHSQGAPFFRRKDTRFCRRPAGEKTHGSVDGQLGSHLAKNYSTTCATNNDFRGWAAYANGSTCIGW